MRRVFIAGNWKMNMLNSTAVEFVKALNEKIGTTNHEVVVFPPSVMLKDITELKSEKIGTGAQNVFFEESGAYTGEISLKMLEDINVGYVLIGHSERRQYFFETDEAINKKVIATLKTDITPVLCVGETLEEREAGTHFKIVELQLKEALKNVSEVDVEKLVIAYEPVWAIGTGKTASADDAEEMLSHIRRMINNVCGDISKKIRCIYGGSVNVSNISELSKCENLDGVLVGGASLKLEDFAEIVKYGA